MANALQKAFNPKELAIAWKIERGRLRSSSFGIDRVGGKQFDAEKAWRIPKIRHRIIDGFKPESLLAIAKPKDSGGHRIICIPTIEDRLIQFSILFEIREALKQRNLLNSVSYGLVANEGRRVQDARSRAAVLREAGRWVYKTDIQKFFDNIPRQILAEKIRSIVRARSLHDVLIAFSNVEIGDGFGTDWKNNVDKAGIKEGVGVRQGMPLSPYFAGILLRDLDLELEARGTPALRYVDDLIAFFPTKKACDDFHDYLQDRLNEMSLTIGGIGAAGSKTRIYQPKEQVDFLGMGMNFDPSGKCRLHVTDKALEKIEARFAEMSDLDRLLQKKLTLPTFGSRLDSMERGYIDAYQGAVNMSELKSRVKAFSKLTLENVLGNLFGDILTDLGKRERKFLGLT